MELEETNRRHRLVRRIDGKRKDHGAKHRIPKRPGKTSAERKRKHCDWEKITQKDSEQPLTLCALDVKQEFIEVNTTESNGQHGIEDVKIEYISCDEFEAYSNALDTQSTLCSAKPRLESFGRSQTGGLESELPQFSQTEGRARR